MVVRGFTVALPLPLAGEGWGGAASAGPDAERAPTRLALLGTLPRKREREHNALTFGLRITSLA